MSGKEFYTQPHGSCLVIKKINTIIYGDCLEEMKKLPDACVDLVVTSPPYNLRNSSGNGMKADPGGRWKGCSLSSGYATYEDNMPYDEYIQWQRDCLTEMMRLIPDTGAIFYNHKWRVQNGLIQDRREIVEGFPVRQIIIWRRNGGVNFNNGYFLPTYEVVYLIAKPKFRLIDGANGHTDVWEIPFEKKNDHPAPFPIKFAERCISSTDAKIVLDPFMGSGTTALAAKNLGRKYIGIELSKEYCEMAEKRLAEASIQDFFI